MESSRLASLEDLAALSVEEKKILDQILAILQSQDIDAKSEMLKNLGNYPIKLLYAFSENSPEMHSLLENNEYLNECWAARLKKMKYPSHAIISFDQKKEISLFSLLKGVPIMTIVNEFLQTEKDLSHPEIFPLLNKACDLGIYKALVLRLGHYTQLIRQSANEKQDIDVITTYITYQLRDAQKLSNLYWALGCIDASLVLLNCAQYYYGLKDFRINVDSFTSTATKSQFSWASKYDDGSRPYPITILQLAVQNIYIARLLSEFRQSKQIIDEIMHGRGMLDGFENVFKNNDELQKYVIKQLDVVHLPLAESFCRNAYKHSVKTIHQHYPDYGLPEEMPESWLG